MKSKLLILAVSLIIAAPSLGAGLFGGPPEPGQMPSRFVRIDAYDLGVLPLSKLTPSDHGYEPLLSGRVAKVTVALNRLRMGAALVEGYQEFDGWSGNMLLPVHVGYTIFTRPRKTQFLYNAVPDVYAEASGSPWGRGSVTGVLGFRYGPALRIGLCCDADIGVVGARFETGWADVYRDSGSTSRVSLIYAGLQLRLLAFGIGF